MVKEKFENHTEEDLWLQYRKTNDIEIRDYFVELYAPLVKYVAGKIAMNMPSSIDFDDLVGYGVFGLFDAIEKFEPNKHVKFKTYAVLRIRGAIFDELRAMDWVPRSVRQKSKMVDDAIATREAELGRSVTDEEIAEYLGMDLRELQKTMMKISGTTILSINEMWYTGDDTDSVSISDTLESPISLNPDHNVEKDEVKRVLVDAIKELPEKAQQVLVMYYFEDLTLKEIGKVLEVTESRVSQLHSKSILKLRSKLTNLKNGIL
ncbi:MAG: RNA polymerase sigma factor WhiG [Spirochaetales bacterium]|nr:RNA polymerase sigma factor WhiG [Spirochaetales bacterium]